MNAWTEYVEPVLTHLQHPPVAGLFGALLSLRWAPSRSFVDLAFCFFGGASCALFLGPWLMDVLNIYSTPGKLGFSLVVGMLGLNLLVKAMDWMRESSLWQIVWTVFDAVRGVRK